MEGADAMGPRVRHARDPQSIQQWAEGLRFEQSAMGREELLDDTDTPVVTPMDRQEMEKCVDELMVQPGSSVLEVGFGVGYSAERIQQAKPASHTIVECAPVVLRRLREWAKDRPGVRVVEGTWQSCLPSLGKFDRIFFDASHLQGLQAQEMANCPDPKYRQQYLDATIPDGSTVADAFESIVRAWHCNRGARVTSGDGTEFRQWTDGFFFSTDRDGKEQLLDVDGVQVMMEWERPYMVECVEELSIDSSCDVLEIGFGCGYSAGCIQRKKPRTHTIIECAEPVLQRLRVWAADKPNVRVVEGTWQARLPELGVFDCVFFDDYGLPGRAEREMQRCPKEDYREEYDRAMAEEGGTHFEAFLRIVLAWHARPGSRFSGFLLHQLPAGAAEQIEMEEHYRYIEVSVPDHCNYFFSNRAIVPLFVKSTQPSSPPLAPTAAATGDLLLGECSTSAGSHEGDSASPSSPAASSRSRSRGGDGRGGRGGRSGSRSRSPRRSLSEE